MNASFLLDPVNCIKILSTKSYVFDPVNAHSLLDPVNESFLLDLVNESSLLDLVNEKACNSLQILKAVTLVE